jgi:hypothetical protein
MAGLAGIGDDLSRPAARPARLAEGEETVLSNHLTSTATTPAV